MNMHWNKIGKTTLVYTVTLHSSFQFIYEVFKSTLCVVLFGWDHYYEKIAMLQNINSRLFC